MSKRKILGTWGGHCGGTMGELPLGLPLSHIYLTASNQVSLQLPACVNPRNQKIVAQVAGIHAIQMRNPTEFLALAWPSPSNCFHLSDEPVILPFKQIKTNWKNK